MTPPTERNGGINPSCSGGGPQKKPYVRPLLKTYPATEEARRRAGLPESLQVVVPLAKGASQGED